MKNRTLQLLIAAALALCGGVSGAFAGTFRHITIDGSFDDWAGVPLAATRSQIAGDAVALQNLYVANDEDYLYLRFSLYAPANPFTSRQNIFFDTDTNAATGYSEPGFGSELLIQSGNAYRETNGAFNGGSLSGLDWLSAPAAPASEFEVRLSRGITYTNGAPVFANKTTAIFLESDETGGNRWLPDVPGGVVYTFAALSNLIVPGQAFVTNSYTSSTEDMANPERGFYLQADTWASAPTSVPSNLASYRTIGSSSPGNTYSAKISLLLRLFYLDSFIDAPISSDFLNSIQADFDSIRAQGDKVIVRFAYTKNTTRPYGEPSKAQILAHIDQLKPLLKKNSDVIAVLQMGMIAAWGEGYYTDVFYTNNAAMPQNWLDRFDVLNALLAALPPERMIQVRIPQFKQKYVYGTNALTSVPPMNPALAFNGSNFSRVGFHNDCYLASSTDYGTFGVADYGVGTTDQDVTNLRNYLAAETRFAPMGGETCNVYLPDSDCASAGGRADTDMAFSHYSFLNEGYNANVNDQWVDHGCIEDIRRRLGYRLELVSGIFRTEAQPGQVIPLSLQFTNSGFAAPYNPRGIELILRNTDTGKKFFAALSRDTDARRWLPGTNIVLNAQLSLPPSMPNGDYEMLLNLPDPATTLYTNNAYSIHLANSNSVSSGGSVIDTVWEPATGYHRLGCVLTVNATATNAAQGGVTIPVLDYSAIAETYATWRARNFASNPDAGDPYADPDGDGRINLLEYALGSDPNVSESGSYLNVSYQHDQLLLSFQKGAGAKDVDFLIEGSQNLAPATWSTSTVAIVSNDASILSASYGGTQSTGFLRLRIVPK
jgi:hypothetical protein